jgi:N-hydroxyarylamine O-acetyltransferase
MSFDLEAYLARLGHQPAGDGSIETLRGLHRAHALAIPFENLDILLGRPIRLDLESLQGKLVRGRRGGYCFEHNTLFAAALEALGLQVTTLAARVRMGRSGPTSRTHMILEVEAAGERWLADVGFGGAGLLDPLPFASEEPVRQGAWKFRLQREGDLHVVQWLQAEGWQDLYAFNLEPQLAIDFEVANHFTSTWPGSPFVTGVRAQRPGLEERLDLSSEAFVVTRPEGEERTRVTSNDQLLDILATRFDLSFPSGTPLWSPPGA